MAADQAAPAPGAAAFASLVELRAVQARLGERRRREPDSPALWDAVEQFVQRGRATGVVLDDTDERWTVQGLLDYWAASLERAGRPRCESSLVEFDAELAPELPDAACPYLGLNAFQEKDSHVFFGRDALVDAVVDQLAAHRLVALVGPSGCGKSSLAFAGLLGRLRRGALPGSEGWRILPPMVPGPEPRATLASLLDSQPRDADAAPTLVVVVDQFEELFTLCRSEDERAGFVADLLALTETTTAAPHRVVLTVRSDFESFVARQPALYELYRAGRVAVTPPSATELRQAIEGPAALVGLRFEAGVVDRLLGELLGEPAGLPLLQFTLLRLWDERRRNRVAMERYERVGGGRQALARTADAVYNKMIPQDQLTAQRILLLVGLAIDDAHELTRTRVPRTAFFGAGEDPGRVERVLDKLIAARLLRQTVGKPHPTPQVEVAHEALVRNWPRLAGWIQEAQQSLAERRRLEAKVTEWIERGRGAASLLDRVELSEAVQWLQGDAAKKLGYVAELRALVAASRSEIERVERQTQDARRLLAMTYLEQGRALLLDGHPMQALPYFVAARAEALDGPVLRMLFAQAARNLPLITLAGHGASVTGAAFSPDGARVVTVSDDRTARVWIAATGAPAGPPLEHGDVVLSAAFSPDGTRVVTASWDKTARVWDAATGRPLTPALEHGRVVTAAAFSPDGTRVVTASQDQTARVWDAALGTPVTAPLEHRDVVLTAMFSPDGARVVTASRDRTACVWDAALGAPVTPPLEHLGAVLTAAFSRDGTRVVTASDDRTARIWDAVTGAPVAPPLEHWGAALTAAFSPDGTRVVTTSADMTARVWDAALGAPITPHLPHQGPVLAAAFSRDGTRVVTASEDKTARIWDAASGAPVTLPLEHLGGVWTAMFSPDDTRVVTASGDKTARIWNASPWWPAPLVLGHHDVVAAAGFSPDGTRVVTASFDGTARVWDTATGAPVTPPFDHLGPVSAAAFSPDGTRVVTASFDNTARVWDAATGAPLAAPLQHRGPVPAAVFSPDGTRVVTASFDKTARVWDAATGAPVTGPLEHGGPIPAVAFSPDGTRVATASFDKTARVWDAATGAPVTAALEHDGGVHTVAFGPGGTRVVTASWDKTARIWDAATGEPVTPPLEHQGTVNTAAFSRDGTRVVTASGDMTARVWNASTGKPVSPPLEHQGTVNIAAFGPEAACVVTASDDRTARVWDTQTGTPVTPPLEHRATVLTAAFSPDAARLVSASEDRTAQIWILPIDNGSLDDWLLVTRCSPFAFVNGVLTANPEPLTIARGEEATP